MSSDRTKTVTPRWRRTLLTLRVAALEAERGRPLDPPGAWLRLAPWVSAGAIAFVLVPFVPGGTGTETLIAATLVPAVVGISMLLPWERMPAWTQGVPPFFLYVGVALVRSGIESPLAAYTPVVLVPVIWFALFGTRAELVLSVAAVGVTLALPSPATESAGTPEILVAAALSMVIAGIVGIAITELMRQREGLETRLAHLARTDALTGLPNRRAWDGELERELARADRSGAPLCAALLDLDRFKEFNDRDGHLAGDDHLRAVALSWRQRLRDSDLIARYGGEEFAVILTATGLFEAGEVIEVLREAVPLGETVSGGVAQWNGSESGKELLARADRALYQAKRAGRDMTVIAGREPEAARTA